MTDLVPQEKIEDIVGASRDSVLHLGRAVSAEEIVYILHSHLCLKANADLRDCIFSKALDAGIDLEKWEPFLDETVVLQWSESELLPFCKNDPGEFNRVLNEE